MRRILLSALILLLIPGAALSQNDIPPESLEALQECFAVTRDKLWEINDERFWHNGEYERCIAVTKLIAQMDPHDVQAYEVGAWLMQNQLRDDEAEAFLLQGLAHNKDIYDLYFSLGWFYYMRLRFDEAVAYLEMAVSYECPQFVWNALAHAYEQVGRVDEALEIWLLAEAKAPDHVVPNMNIERIITGGPPSSTPYINTQWREQRRQRELETE